jgi:O-antigen ligase
VISRHASTEALELPAPTQDARRWGWVAPWAYALALALWASSWNLRLSVLMDWSPIEPVWIGTAAVVLCAVHRCGQPLRLAGAVTGPILLLAVGFVPGALLSSGQDYGLDKLTSMTFVLFPVVLAATALLDSSEARRGWVWVQLLVGVAVAVAALEFHDPTNLLEPGRFTLATVDTISSARLVGVAVVVFLLLGLGSLKRSWWALPLAAAGGAVLVHIGSRGPVLAVLVTVVVVVLVGRCFARYRIVFVLVLLAGSVAAFRLALVAGGSGGKRIIDSLESGFSDGVRARLLNDAVRLGTAHPLGIGWGDFAQDSKVGRSIANEQLVSYAHNVFAEAFSEGGVLALLAFALVVVLALWRLQQLTSDPMEAVVLGTVLYWVLNAQVSSDFVGNRFMWIALACGVAAYVPRPARTSAAAPGRSAP